MKRKNLAFLLICIVSCAILLTSCDGDSDSASKEEKLDNNSKVTKDNFTKFPKTDPSLFESHLAEDGDVNHVKITGIKRPEGDKEKVIIVPKKLTMKTANGEEEKIVTEVAGLSHLKKVEAIVLPDTIKYIGTNAFVDNENLKYIDLGKSVEKTGGELFIGSPLEYLDIPDSMQHMGNTMNDFAILNDQITQSYDDKHLLKYIRIPGTLTDFSNLYLHAGKWAAPVIKTPKGSEGEKWAKYWGFEVEHIEGKVTTPEKSIWGEQLEKQKAEKSSSN